MSKVTAPIYQIKITLKDSKPPIWRRVLISSETTLPKLHDIIQEAMGWYDSHLHAFVIHDEQYSAPMPYDPHHLQEMGMKNTSRVKLNKLISAEGEKFRYEYDFGDDWQHEIVLEKILPADPKQKLPVCIRGNAPVRQKMSVESGAMIAFLRQSKTLNIPNMKTISNGLVMTSTPKPLI